MTYPKVSIIILNWSGLEDTIECLESLKKITYPNYDVIVVDNGSAGDDAEVLKEKFGSYIHVIRNDKNYGFAEGNNIGMRYALHNSSPDYFLILNNDTVVDSRFLTELVKVAETNEKLGIDSPKMCYYDKPHMISSAGARIKWHLGLGENIGIGKIDTGQFDSISEVDCLLGAALLMKRSMVQEIGLFDERFFLLLEDTDLCIRAKKREYEIKLSPCSKIYHKGGFSAGRGTLYLYYMYRNRLLLLKKHCTLSKVILYSFYISLRTLAAFFIYIVKRELKLAKAVINGYCDGLFKTKI